MANEINKGQVIVSGALDLLHQDIVLARLVSRDASSDFKGQKNDTVNIRRPARLVGEELELRGSTAVTAEDIKERNLSVKLTRELVSAVALTQVELTLDVDNFGAQVVGPQAESIAQRIERNLAAHMVSETTSEVAIGTGEGEVRKAIIGARKALNQQDVPTSGRILAVGAAVEAELLMDPNLIKANEAGTDTALRGAILGRLFGFTVVSAPSLAEDVALGFHPTAFILVTRSPIIPQGAAYGASQTHKGFALTHCQDYDAFTRKDRSLLNTYMGLGTVLDEAKDPETGEYGAEEQVRSVKLVLGGGGGSKAPSSPKVDSADLS